MTRSAPAFARFFQQGVAVEKSYFIDQIWAAKFDSRPNKNDYAFNRDPYQDFNSLVAQIWAQQPQKRPNVGAYKLSHAEAVFSFQKSVRKYAVQIFDHLTVLAIILRIGVDTANLAGVRCCQLVSSRLPSLGTEKQRWMAMHLH